MLHKDEEEKNCKFGTENEKIEEKIRKSSPKNLRKGSTAKSTAMSVEKTTWQRVIGEKKCVNADAESEVTRGSVDRPGQF